MGADVLPLEHSPSLRSLGREGSRLEGARTRCARRPLARARAPPPARGPANGHPSRTRRGSPPSSRPPHSTLRVDLAYPGSRGRGRRGPALTERSATPLDARVVRAALKPLPKDAGKEARGRALIVGRSLRYPGSTLLASPAAVRCGAGVVSVAPPRSVVEAIAGQDPNVTFFPLAESQPSFVATGAAAQLSTIASEKTRALLLGP